MSDNSHTSPVGNAAPAASGSRKEIFNIQVARFVAASMVLVSHTQHEIVTRPDLGLDQFRPVELVWWPGGVDIFFVISGFIMCYISRAAFGAPGASTEFIARRLARLVPLYWSVTTAMLLATIMVPGEIQHSQTGLAQVVSSYLFLPHENPDGAYFPLFIGGWTLNYEMLFYIVFACFIGRPRVEALTAIAFTLIGLAALSLLGLKHGPWSFWCDPIVLNFLYGILIAVLYERGVRLSRGVGAVAIILGIAGMILARSMGWAGGHWGLRFVWAGLPAFLIVSGGVLRLESGALGSVRRMLVFGGDASYSLYLTHPFVLGVLTVLFRLAHLANPWLYVAAALPASLAAAALIYQFVELPIYRWLSRRLKRWLTAGRARPVRLAD